MVRTLQPYRTLYYRKQHYKAEYMNHNKLNLDQPSPQHPARSRH